MGLFMVTYPFFGYFNGYSTAKIYTLFNGSRWNSLVILTLFTFPSTLFILSKVILIFDPQIFQRLIGQSITLRTTLYLQFFINTPSTLLGTYMGLISEKLECPTKQNRAPRDIPKKLTRSDKAIIFTVSGLFPFIALSVQIG